MKELLTELWTKYRKCSLFAFGMACFLAAGLLVWALPERPEPLAARAARTEETAPSPAPEDSPPAPVPEKIENDGESAEERMDDRWFLYVTGNVRNPGVYRLPPGARLVHLVEAAGGLNNFADSTAVNLAAPLEDGMHVHVPKKGERKPEQTVFLDVPVALSAPEPGLNFNESGRRAPSGSRGFPGALVDVNRATEEELIGLKGIGPVLAKSIVEYRRKNGPFRSVDDLVRVRGIGLKKLEGFRDRVVARP